MKSVIYIGGPFDPTLPENAALVAKAGGEIVLNKDSEFHKKNPDANKAHFAKEGKVAVADLLVYDENGIAQKRYNVPAEADKIEARDSKGEVCYHPYYKD